MTTLIYSNGGNKLQMGCQVITQFGQISVWWTEALSLSLLNDIKNIITNAQNVSVVQLYWLNF